MEWILEEGDAVALHEAGWRAQALREARQHEEVEGLERKAKKEILEK